MTITIKSEGNVSPTLFTTQPPSSSSDGITGAFFDESSFDLDTIPKWIRNKPATVNGSYKHFLSNDDSKLNVTLHLTGTSRFDNLGLWRNMSGTTFYLNSDTDTNLNGNYIMTNLKPRYFPTQTRIELKMMWELVTT